MASLASAGWPLFSYTCRCSEWQMALRQPSAGEDGELIVDFGHARACAGFRALLFRWLDLFTYRRAQD
jgi:hypothetical protein